MDNELSDDHPEEPPSWLMRLVMKYFAPRVSYQIMAGNNGLQGLMITTSKKNVFIKVKKESKQQKKEVKRDYLKILSTIRRKGI